MTAWQSVVLGIIWGITEFTPVSSSAHLLLVPWILEWHIAPDGALTLSVLGELGAFVALILFFWTDLRALVRAGVLALTTQSLQDPQARLAGQVALATIPAALVGLVRIAPLQEFLSKPLTLGAFLLVSGAVLYLSDLVRSSPRPIVKIRWSDAALMGIAQAIGLLPGVSRLGLAISAARSCGLNRPASARFSFWMAMPILLERGIAGLSEIARLPNFARDLPIATAGFVASLVVGFLSVGWVLRYLTMHTLRVFAIYCFGLGSLAILLSYMR
jgi:undecaprenyl-diphosphatase